MLIVIGAGAAAIALVNAGGAIRYAMREQHGAAWLAIANFALLAVLVMLLADADEFRRAVIELAHQ